MSYHTSVSDKLRTGFSNFTDSLFGTGPEAYMKGNLYKSRIGANEALTGNRLSQTRDLDYSHDLKQQLVQALSENKNPRMLRAIQAGGNPAQYVGASIASGREDVRGQSLIDMLASGDPDSAALAQNLQLGMTGPESATMARTNLLAPKEEALLEAQTGAIGDKHLLATALNEANIGKLQSGAKAFEAQGQKYRTETANLVQEGLMDFHTGNLNLKRIEALMGQEAAVSAQKINTLKSKKSEHDKNFSLANEKLTQLTQEGKNYNTAMKHLATIQVDGDVTLADFAAVGSGALSTVFHKGQRGGAGGGEKTGLSAITNAMSSIRKELFNFQNMKTYQVTAKDGSTISMVPMQMSEKQRKEVFDRKIQEMKINLQNMGYDMKAVEKAIKDDKGGGAGGGRDYSAIADKFRNR